MWGDTSLDLHGCIIWLENCCQIYTIVSVFKMGPKTRSVSMSKAQYMREYRAKLSPSVKKERHRKQVEKARLRRQALRGKS